MENEMKEQRMGFWLCSALCLVVALVACGDKDGSPAASAGDNDTGTTLAGSDTAGQAADTSAAVGVDGKTVTDSADGAADVTPGGVDAGSALKWFKSCGAPVCKGDGWKATAGVSLCVDQKEGGGCSKAGQTCDAKHGCQVFLICADKDPRQQRGGCPISSRRYKTDIRYLTFAQEKRVATELLGMPLTSWLYRDGDDRRRLGFIIEDIPGSVAVDKARERVDLYSYISMAVATLKVQQRRIDRLEQTLEELSRRKGVRQRSSTSAGKARP
jgi:hypothetical protein